MSQASHPEQPQDTATTEKTAESSDNPGVEQVTAHDAANLDGSAYSEQSEQASQANGLEAESAAAGAAATETGPAGAEPPEPQDDYLEALQRLKAEFNNYRRRVRQQQHESAEQATAALVEKLLPVVDACEAALSLSALSADTSASAKETNSLLNEHEGLVKLAELLLSVLQDQGLKALQPEGEAFDPNLHEAIEHVSAETGETNTEGPVVKEVARTGYLWCGKLLRPALVKVRG